MDHDDYVRHDALGLAALIRRGEVTPLELLDLAIARTETTAGPINAVVLKHYDEARAAIRADLPDGPFTGVPFLLKDLMIQLKGTVTTNGLAILAGRAAPADSTAVARYKRAGLVIFGKTHSPGLGGGPTTESALYGVTRNPWNMAMTPNGSSGGAAAAVAAGIVPAAHGSDAGGSIRLPASATGLFGLKPTRGRVPLGPARYDGGGVATLHALTRSVRDSAALLDAVAGPEPGALYGSPAADGSFLAAVGRDPGRLRIAVVREAVGGGVADPACLAAVDDAARLCADLGHALVEATVPVDPDLFQATRETIFAVATAAGIRDLERVLGRTLTADDVEPATWVSVERGFAVPAVQYAAAREAMFTMHRALAAFMDEHDVILSPVSQRMPPAPGTIDMQKADDATYREVLRYVDHPLLQNLTGQPSMSVPLHWTADNLPVGAMFSGRFGEEALLFSLAGQLERARPWFDRRPPGH